MSDDQPVLYAVVCGAGPAARVERLVVAAQQRGWSVRLIATAAALAYFLDVPGLEAITGHPVRSTYRGPGEPGSLPPATAVVVAPATYNTINKWAAGIADTYPLSTLAELTGQRIPSAVLPFVNTAFAANAAFRRSVERLRAEGVNVLLGPGGFEPHPPRTGDARIEDYPWHLVLDAVRQAAG